MLKKLCLLSFVSLSFILYSLFLFTPVLADARYDNTPPVCTINPDPLPTFQRGSSITIYVTATDLFGIELSTFTVTADNPKFPSLNPSTACIYDYSYSEPLCTTQENTYTWTDTEGGSYTLNITATDKNGNIMLPADCPKSFSVNTDPSYLKPWIQTTNGDVHSNKRIYTPGGP